ncbi:peptidase [Synechococcus phage S-CAM7]|uniref:Peptidase n=1 Tax=Synechococcus phage S-CAM7 TaxID=1883368 RepID=A0A1D8KTW5_9CAUD|nr:peptidase [Synechococcus phage S-CAM7]AOV62082.1 peptidase [Synechococcus phage S-CAM7]
MSVNLEVKGTLARLLATEDLLVEHKNVSTASFNVHSRVLTLPRWEKASNNVFNLLISHEVAHALFTPDEDWRKKTKIPQGFINVTEDVRIEVLMKKKYAGLPKTFFRGYQELHDQDFFGIADEDVSAMNIADRVNLHFKIGNFLKVPFTAAEMVVVDQCAAAVTFDDAIAAAEALYALHEQQKEEQQQSANEEVSSSPESTEEPQGNDGGESEEPEEAPSDSEGESSEGGAPQEGEGDEEPIERTESDDSENVGGDSAGNLTDEVSTMENFNENLEDMATKSTYNEPLYLTYPSFPADKYVATNKDVHEYISTSFTMQRQFFYDNNPENADYFINNLFGVYDKKYAEFKRNIQSEVNYMVKEFECKKSAAAYSRASTSRTGVLDCTKLHTYKYNEDLFKKVTTLPQGKNHGLVFVLDWSGSMCYILEDTIKQLLSIVMFCDKVNIPFEVYAFTNEWNRDNASFQANSDTPNEFMVGDEFSMMNILTSTVNRKELQRQMQTIFMIAASYNTRGGDIVPSRVGLSGTPLNEALISLRKILPQFKKNNNVEKAHVMVLTDGEAGWTRYTTEIQSYDGQSKISVGRLGHQNGYLRNRVTGSVRKIDKSRLGGVTTSILEDLRDEFPESTFTGFRILERRGNWFVRQAVQYDETQISKWKKEKSIALTNAGYNKYFIVASDSIQESTEFDVDEGATKAKIKSAFTKSLKSKKSNKKVLGDFISLIA